MKKPVDAGHFRRQHVVFHVIRVVVGLHADGGIAGRRELVDAVCIHEVGVVVGDVIGCLRALGLLLPVAKLAVIFPRIAVAMEVGEYLLAGIRLADFEAIQVELVGFFAHLCEQQPHRS